MADLLNKTRILSIILLHKGVFMRVPKRDYWSERGFSSREDWTKSKRKEYREKTKKVCSCCGEYYHGNRKFCSNKCNILSNIEIKENGCWEWKKFKNPLGYGMVKDYENRTQEIGNSQKNIFVHRLSYKIFKENPPKNKFVCHTCDNPSCCNPEHLFLGSPKDNARDALRKKRLNLDGLTFRLSKGGKSPASKLEPFLSEIRESILKEERIAEIAERYNVSPQTIYSIKHGKTWKEDYGKL